MKLTRFARPPMLLGALALAVPACAADDALELEDADTIASELELENGGLDTADEAPAFGEPDRFDAADLEEPDAPFTDQMETDVAPMMESPDAAVFPTTLLWGQIPGNPDNETAHDWSGQLSVNRGALIIRRVIRFEGRTDEILPRTNRQVIEFRSATLPHHDGLRIVIVDPDPRADEPLVLTYLGNDGTEISAPVARLLEGPHSVEVDDAGNRMVVAAMARPVDTCEHGFMHGRWRKVGERGGVLRGVVNAADGTRLGHMRGLYGVRRDGAQVFFGKYVDREGQFRGIFAGTYRNGQFRGRWMTRTGNAGALGGEYRETAPGDEIGGHFLGRWAETRCDIDPRDLPQPDPSRPDAE